MILKQLTFIALLATAGTVSAAAQADTVHCEATSSYIYYSTPEGEWAYSDGSEYTAMIISPDGEELMLPNSSDPESITGQFFAQLEKQYCDEQMKAINAPPTPTPVTYETTHTHLIYRKGDTWAARTKFELGPDFEFIGQRVYNGQLVTLPVSQDLKSAPAQLYLKLYAIYKEQEKAKQTALSPE